MAVTFVAVDWSGARVPSGKIWLAEASGGVLCRLDPVDTREDAVRRIADYGHAQAPVVVGLDFSFSFPAWFCRYLGLSEVAGVWREAADRGEAWLAGCPWPFWGRPGKPRPDVPSLLRRTESSVAARFSTSPKSTFQIGGAGAVGTGSIRGMPHLLRLRDVGCAVWPFDAPQHVTIVEMYPRALTGPVIKSRFEARRNYLRQMPSLATWRETDVRHAEASEDAFDAAVSAVVMSVGGTGPVMPETLDDIGRLEGEIWVPGVQP